MKTATLYCANCKKKTPHAEDTVVDRESATVWHCLFCGHDQRPDGGNAKVSAKLAPGALIHGCREKPFAKFLELSPHPLD